MRGNGSVRGMAMIALHHRDAIDRRWGSSTNTTKRLGQAVDDVFAGGMGGASTVPWNTCPMADVRASTELCPPCYNKANQPVIWGDLRNGCAGSRGA
jgi:hypothetical protein